MIRWFILAMLALALAPAGALASKEYRFSGTVERVGPGSVTIRSGTRELEFDMSSRSDPALRDARPGDHVTVWYDLEPRRAKKEGPSRPEPGRTPPPADGMDDRLFYDSRRSSERPGISVAKVSSHEPSLLKEDGR
jgi:hypothetical protein